MTARNWFSEHFHRILLVAALAVLAGTSTAAQAQTPTPTPGKCCVPHDSPGCESSACTACVCDIDPVSCIDEWDEISVGIAEAECDDVCSCSRPTPTPGGDCCTTSAGRGPGCDDLTCEDCVCGADPLCCSQTWDATCVGIARSLDECAQNCACVPLPTETPAPTPTPGGDCCAAHGGPSCDDQACRECVCTLDGACCADAWDQTCADEAAVECALSCEDCASGGDCCAPHDGVGCSDAPCKDCVCDVDAACCTESWDQQCVDEANAECAASCICEAAGSCCVEHTETVGCDNRACQNCVCAIDANCCIEGWDATCADEAANECQARCTECEQIDCCVEQEDAGCASDAVCEDCVCGIDGFCCDELWDAGCADIAGSECSTDCLCESSSGCPGDCNDDGEVTVNELIIGVNIALGSASIDACFAFDTNVDDQVSVAELVQSVNAALNGCPT